MYHIIFNWRGQLDRYTAFQDFVYEIRKIAKTHFPADHCWRGLTVAAEAPTFFVANPIKFARNSRTT